MGGIADYSGSLVLELPLAVGTAVAAQAMAALQFEVLSPEVAASGAEPLVSLPLSNLLASGDEPYYLTARKLLANDPKRSWAAYLAGVLVVLQHEYRLPLKHGVRLLVHSAVPTGKGVSSSAALEVATMQALCGLYGLELTGREMALLCQQAENLVVGAPCGIMDQMTVACGQKDHLLALLCQPAELQKSVSLPPEVQVWGLDSGIRHAVSGSDYSSVRVGAFMGYRLIAERRGLKAEQISPVHVKIEDTAGKGYLANISPQEWETAYRDWVPEEIPGREFLARWGGTTDFVTEVNPAQTYAVRQPTAHPIYEHYRVSLFRQILEAKAEKLEQADLIILGNLMYESHQSYSRCGLGSSGTDRLVELVQQAGPASGLYGAKITGGGAGGTVAVLGLKSAEEAVQQIARQYEQETGRQALILSGSSPGASSAGPTCLIKI
jgi:L-arabinokinase